MVSGGGLPPGILGRRRPAKPLLPGGDPSQADEAQEELSEQGEGVGGHPRRGGVYLRNCATKNPSSPPASASLPGSVPSQPPGVGERPAGHISEERRGGKE